MSFSAKQLQALRRQPSRSHIRTREAHGRELSYLEGWYAISEANRIFGFDGWSRETLESRCVMARETRGTFLTVYLARVRVTVQADGATIIREGHGTGEGRGTAPGEVHDIALKAAETDATKRALATFGKPFGLELYRGGKAAASQKPPPVPSVPVPADARTGFHPDDTTPIPRTNWLNTFGMSGGRWNEPLRWLRRWCQGSSRCYRRRSTKASSPSPSPSGRDKAHLKFVDRSASPAVWQQKHLTSAASVETATDVQSSDNASQACADD